MPIINGTNDGEELQDTGGDDVIFAMGGNDFIYLSDGFDDVRGGSGLDTLVLAWLSSTGAVVNLGGPSVNLADGGYDGSFSVTGGGRGVTYTSIEQFRISAGSGDDIITAADGNDQLSGGAGSDTLNGAGGGDALDVGEGFDQANGGTGFDILYFDYSLSTASVTGGGLSANGSEGGFDGSFSDGSGFRTVTFTSIEAFVITTGSGNDNLTLGAGSHQVHLGAGNDFVNLGSGRLGFSTGGDGEDGFSANYSGSMLSVSIQLLGGGVLSGFEYIGTLTGSESNDSVSTGTVVRNETIHLGGGADFATVYNGADIVNGGIGDDTLLIDFSTATTAISSAVPAANAGEGGFNGSYAVDANRNVVYTSIAHIGLYGGSGGDSLRTAAGDDAIFGGAGNDFIDGGDGADQLFGGEDNDNLVGGGGADHLEGGNGDDLYTVDGGDIIVEAANGGRDGLLIAASGSYSLAALPNVEDLDGNVGNDALTGNEADNRLRGNSGEDQLFGLGGNDNLFGQADNDRLEGGDGNDTLTGGTGRDVLLGGAGDDLFSIEQADDEAIEAIGGGNDVVRIGNIAGGFALLAGSEIETLETFSVNNTLAQDLTGNEFAQTVRGNAGVNILRGEGGNDTLHGLGGNDFLVGGTGSDILVGGLGDDTYYFDQTTDAISEFAGQGFDRLATVITLALAADADIERLDVEDLTSTNAIDLTGSGIGNVIYGNDGQNILRGEAGNDELRGFGGNDFLVGGTGTDLMVGGAGDDTFYVDDASDAIGEIAGEGNDRIAASVSFVLSNGANVELLEAVNLTATAAFDLTGSDSNNTITGNNGVNILRGEGGNDILSGAGGDDFLVGGSGTDSMTGGSGNDTYYVDEVFDAVFEIAGEGTSDRVTTTVSHALFANADIERLEAADQGAAIGMDLIGSSIANIILGNEGTNVIDGKGGSDTLEGFGGADTYQFTTALAAGNVDAIIGFASGSDKIRLDDAMFAGLAIGGLAPSAFVTGSAAADADDRIIYNSATGALFYDADGNGAGAAVQFATLAGNPAIVVSDFLVI